MPRNDIITAFIHNHQSWVQIILTNWKSYSQSQSKWPYNHDLKSLACTHDLKRIGIAKSVKISTLLSNHFPNQFLYARLRELHNWNFRIFKKRWQICFFSQVSKLSERFWKWFDGNQIKSLIVSGKSQSILLWLGISLFQIPILVWLGMEDCEIRFDTQLIFNCILFGGLASEFSVEYKNIYRFARECRDF